MGVFLVGGTLGVLTDCVIVHMEGVLRAFLTLVVVAVPIPPVLGVILVVAANQSIVVVYILLSRLETELPLESLLDPIWRGVRFPEEFVSEAECYGNENHGSDKQ